MLVKTLDELPRTPRGEYWVCREASFANLVMETDDGALIGMTYLGMRHGPKEVMDRMARGENVSPSEYYMRATPYYETASEKYGWLNRMVSIACGHRMPGGAIYQVFEIL